MFSSQGTTKMIYLGYRDNFLVKGRMQTVLLFIALPFGLATTGYAFTNFLCPQFNTDEFRVSKLYFIRYYYCVKLVCCCEDQ